MQAIHKSPTGCNTRPLSISKVSWMFDLYFLIYYRIQFLCVIQDGHHMLDDKLTIKDTLHYLFVALYLFPKFHECLTNTFWFIAGFSLLGNSRWPPSSKINRQQKILFTISLLPFIYFQSFMNVRLLLFDLLHDSVLLRNSRWPPWRPSWKMNRQQKILFTISLLPFIYFQNFMNVRLILHELLQYQHFGRTEAKPKSPPVKPVGD